MDAKIHDLVKTGRLMREIYPDGSEIITLDNEPIAQFGPLIVVCTEESDGFKVIVSQTAMGMKSEGHKIKKAMGIEIKET